LKPLEIVLLVAASAIGGALIMKIAQRPARLLVPAPAPVVAQVQASAPAPVTAPAPAPAPEPAAPKAHARPSPFVPPLPGNPEPIAVAESEPAPVAAPPAAVPAAEPPKEEPAPPAQPVPPVRVEPENATPPPPGPEGTPPEPHKVTLNTGMLLPVRLVDGLSSERNAPGDAFLATLDKELVVDGFVIAERGARVEGRVVASNAGGKMKGTAGIAVELIRLHTSDGQNVTIRTDSFERHAEPDRGGDVEKVAVGAAVGAVIGAAAGGGKGAAIGAGVGGGAGAGDVMLTRGKPATLPTETRITFRLREPTTLTERM
jgi:hypothetical protein